RPEPEGRARPGGRRCSHARNRARARMCAGGGSRCPLRRQPAAPEPPHGDVGWLQSEMLRHHRQISRIIETNGPFAQSTGRGAGVRDRFFRSVPHVTESNEIFRCDTGALGLEVRGRFFQDPLRRHPLDFDSDDRPACYHVVSGRISLRSFERCDMARKILGVVAGLAVWVAVVGVVGAIMRASWPAYSSVADAMTFTLPMLFARLSIGTLATLATAPVPATIVPQSKLARLIPGVLLLIGFIPVHVMLWDKFPVWYHLTFLLSLVPLTFLGGTGRGLAE